MWLICTDAIVSDAFLLHAFYFILPLTDCLCMNSHERNTPYALLTVVGV